MEIDDRQEALWRQHAALRAGPRTGVPLGRAGPVGPVDPVAHTSGEGSFRVRG